MRLPDSGFNKLIYLCLLITIFAGFWLRVADLDKYPPGISNDEAKNLIDSVYIAQTGRTPLYEDEGRPEPVNRIAAAFASILYGNSVWAFRLTSAFWGVVTLAATYWTTTQCFFNTSPYIRKLAGLMATIALCVALGHITVTRSLYRAVPLPLFILLAIGFTVRGLHLYRWSDFIWSGIFLALGIYTYTSGFIVPIIFLPVGVILITFHRRKWRMWLPRLILTGAVLAILTSPIIYLLLTQPSAVLARASSVAEQSNADLSRKIELMVGQFLTQGDENPQYNVANAPIIAPVFVPLFFLGLISLILRLRQPASVIIGGLFILNTIPVLLTDEITHGLRVYSEFAIVPLIIGGGVVLILTLIRYASRSPITWYIAIILIIGLGLYQIIKSQQTYVGFWEDADTEWRKWRIYDRELTHNEWFFRSDRLVLTDWIKAQDKPLLIPVDELYRDAGRGMLMSHYPYVSDSTDDFQLPVDTLVLVPWSLERGRFLDEARHFALLDDSTITLLPPLTAASQNALIDGVRNASKIENPNSNIPIVGKVFKPPEGITLDYQQPAQSGDPIAIFNDELEIVQWYGSDTLTTTGEYTYTFDWSVTRPVSHEYGAFVQLLTQNWERIAGDEQLLLRWLYPTIAWQPDQIIPDTFELDIPSDLTAGAYRLVAGAWYVNGGRMPAQSFIDETADNIATIGWVKVPQKTLPSPPQDAIEVNATLNEQFQLTHAVVTSVQNSTFTIKLYWKSLVDRPSIDATTFVHAINADQVIVSQSDIRPWNGQYPTFIWDENEVVVTEHQLEVINAGAISLFAGMYTQRDFTRLTAHQNGERVPDDLIPLGNLQALIEK